MTEKEYEELKRKLEIEEYRRRKIRNLECEIIDMKSAIEHCGYLNHIYKIDCKVYHEIDITGDGRGGTREEIRNFTIENPSAFVDCMNEYMKELEKKLLQMKEENEL